MNLLLTLMPSLVGQYFETKCDKSLVYNAVYKTYKSVDESNFKKLGLGMPFFKKSAAADAGEHWERILLDRLNQDSTCEVIDFATSSEYKKSFKGTIKALKNLSATEKTIYLYQACLSVTPLFEDHYLSKFNDSETKIVFSNQMFIDFIKAEYIPSKKKFCLTIIDAKNTSTLKVGAELQIALYVKLLKCILKDEEIKNCFVNEEEGIVWNRERITDNNLEHIFKLEDASKEIEEFFSKKINSLCETLKSCKDVNQMQQALDYRISQSCEYCGFFETCKQHCKGKCSVRLMPYITQEAQDRIVELIHDGKLKDDTIKSVKDLLVNHYEDLADNCRYWNIVKNNLDAYVNGLTSYYAGEKKSFPKNSSLSSLPKGQNFSLLLTAQQDVDSGRIYAYSWLLKPGYNIDIFNQGLNSDGWVDIQEVKDSCPGKGTYYNSVVAKNQEAKEFNRIDKVFVDNIYNILYRICEFSVQGKRSLQFYVMDNYEKYNIESALYNMLEYLDPVEEQKTLEKVMAILFWMQGERLVTDAEQQPEECVENPVIVITNEISRLYVLSEGVAYSLKETAKIFSQDYNFIESDEKYFSILTNVVEGKIIINVWKEKDEEKKQQTIEKLARHLRKRLFVEWNIIYAIQKDKCIKLSTWPMQYRMLKPKYSHNPEMARLYFENLYEQLLTYRRIRIVRAGGIQDAIDNGMILWLEYSGTGYTYNILNKENYIGREWFAAWLCEDTPENREQIMLLQDTKYKKLFKEQISVGDKGTVFYPTDFNHEYNFEDKGVNATVDFKPKPKANFAPSRGKRYLLFEVYSDMNSAKTEKGIDNLSGKQDLLNPKQLSSSTKIVFNQETEAICAKYWSPDGNCFSPSQKDAFKHLMEQRLTVLEGPPASGKTDFIARSLITIASYYKDVKHKNIKIMITAMSHSAIENVLLKLDKMLEKNNACGINLYKVASKYKFKFDDEQAFNGKSVSLVADYSIAAKMEQNEIQIIGMTSWSAYNAFHHPQKGQMKDFDMIVMDEASQIRAMDAFLNLECSNKETRFLLVGDDKQLPPIIGGKYREIPGEKYIHGSIFKMYITGLGDNHSDVIKLKDNFRMNGILCKYLETLYGPNYKAFNEKIKKQTIRLKNKPKDDLLASLLDEEYPLIFCVLSGIAKKQNSAEIELVTKLVHELWDNQLNRESGKLAKEDGNFWRDVTKKDGTFLEGACGIISPHHEHINRLKTSISSDLSIPRNNVFIGTVDKLQGKERKTVIVSYGVHEIEKIMNESEFVFSLNRFNVSISRGKAKAIIILSDTVAQSNVTINAMKANNETLKKGIEFIHGFASYMDEQKEGEDLIKEEYSCIDGDVTFLDSDVKIKVWKKRLMEV